jgi:hypothetical protein
VRKWGADNGIQAECVMINQNETVQKVSAAIASNTMPDALDMGLDLLLLLSKQVSSCRSTTSIDACRQGAGRLVSGRRAGDGHAQDRRRPHRAAVRHQRQPAAAAQ